MYKQCKKFVYIVCTVPYVYIVLIVYIVCIVSYVYIVPYAVVHEKCVKCPEVPEQQI